MLTIDTNAVTYCLEMCDHEAAEDDQGTRSSTAQTRPRGPDIHGPGCTDAKTMKDKDLVDFEVNIEIVRA